MSQIYYWFVLKAPTTTRSLDVGVSEWFEAGLLNCFCWPMTVWSSTFKNMSIFLVRYIVNLVSFWGGCEASPEISFKKLVHCWSIDSLCFSYWNILVCFSSERDPFWSTSRCNCCKSLWYCLLSWTKLSCSVSFFFSAISSSEFCSLIFYCFYFNIFSVLSTYSKSNSSLV